jgi:hypothetical protein
MEILEIKTIQDFVLSSKELCGSPTTPNLIEFWKYVPKEQFPKFHDLALRFICRFRSTYICGKTFSSINAIKSKFRSTITDAHLADVLILSTTRTAPNTDKLLSEK